MTINDAIERLQQLKAEVGGDKQLEVQQLNGLDRPVRSMTFVESEIPKRQIIRLQLEDEAVHG